MFTSSKPTSFSDSTHSNIVMSSSVQKCPLRKIEFLDIFYFRTYEPYFIFGLTNPNSFSENQTFGHTNLRTKEPYFIFGPTNLRTNEASTTSSIRFML